MRRIVFLSLALMAVLGFVAPPDAFAQAAAPTPKFTITGLIDNVGTYTNNISTYDQNLNRSRDHQMYGRTRGRFDIIGEVGSAKGVFGFEIDSYWGQTGFTDSNSGTGCATGSAGNGWNCGAVGTGSESSFDINTDTQANLQVKWLYTEFPMPLVPWSTIVRLGAQPFATAAQFKLATYANGDFPGVNLYTTFSPTFKLQLTYVAIDENLIGKGSNPPFLSGVVPVGVQRDAKCTNGSTTSAPGASCTPQARNDNFAIIISPEITPMKGLDIKPMYSYVWLGGQTSGSTRQGRGGVTIATTTSGTTGGQFNSPFNPVCPATTSSNQTSGCDGSGTGIHENRHTIGVDARWRSGPWSVDPTLLWQFGSQQKVQVQDAVGVGGAPGAPGTAYGIAGHRYTADINAMLGDVRASYQAGPLLVSGMVMWTTGQDAKSNPYKSIKYFQPLDTDTSYMADWGTQIMSLGIDYYQILNGTATGSTQQSSTQAGLNPGVAIGYDKYGRISSGLKASYAVTPSLTAGVGVTPNWTWSKVDTDSFLVTGGGLQPSFICRKTGQTCRPQGESNYMGTEWNVALTYRFAPGLVFDWAFGYLQTGNALSHRYVNADYASQGVANNANQPVHKDIGVSDVMLTTARVRFSF